MILLLLCVSVPFFLQVSVKTHENYFWIFLLCSEHTKYIYLSVRILIFTMINKLVLMLLLIFTWSLIMNTLWNMRCALCIISFLIKKMIIKCCHINFVIGFHVFWLVLHLRMMYIYDCIDTNEGRKVRETSETCIRKTERENIWRKKIEKKH